MSADALDTIRSAHRELYGAELDAPLLPAIDVRYRRITLAARGEPLRITIDSDLTFAAGGRTWRCARDAVIVEVKATTRSRYARTLFGQFGQRPVERLSKYCLGMAVSGTVQETNRFHRVLRRLGLEPGLSGAETGRRADRPGE